MAGPTILDEIKVPLTTHRVGGGIFATGNVVVHLVEGGNLYDHTDGYATLVGDDASFSGYTPQPVTAWGTPVLTTDFHALSVGTPVVFTNSGGGSSNPITGWWYEDDAGPRAIIVGQFATPIIIPAGQSFTFTPTWQQTGEELTN